MALEVPTTQDHFLKNSRPLEFQPQKGTKKHEKLNSRNFCVFLRLFVAIKYSWIEPHPIQLLLICDGIGVQSPTHDSES
ncbi:Unannotated [Lentimonas sp. CC8]|nr:Unannotated [Lentimonas sp. CC8]